MTNPDMELDSALRMLSQVRELLGSIQLSDREQVALLNHHENAPYRNSACTCAFRRARDPSSSRPSGAPALSLPTAAQVKRWIRQRELRENVFERGLISDPVWGILLELLLAHLERRHISIKSVSIASGVPPTTALRLITRLENRDLVRRYPDPLDGRRTYLALMDEALDSVAKLFSRMDG